MSQITTAFARRIIGAFGKEGANWLQRLPSILNEIANRWEISLQNPFDDMAYNFVAPVILKDGSEVVLKVGVPNPELYYEMDALRLFNGRGAVRLLQADLELGALLLERLKPGESLLHLENDEEATKIAGMVMRQLWATGVDENIFPSVEYWAGGFQRLRPDGSGSHVLFPQHWLDHAQGLFRDLLASMEEAGLLHGDLHHWNILSAGRQPWLAIDPKGVFGEPAYEVGAWLRNPFPAILAEPFPHRIISRRVDQLSEQLGFDRERLLAWGLAQAVLAAWWSYTDAQEDWESWLQVAALFKI